jgi:uncharacterized protein (DUF433 family)
MSPLRAAEAAFIAGITDRDVSRLVDEEILPDTLYERREGRRFLKLSCAFASFYFATDRDLTRALRQDVIRNLWNKVRGRADQDRILSLTFRIDPAEWKVEVPFGQIEFDRYLIATQQRAQLVDRSYDEIVEDDEIMAGEPVFKGTRIPVWNVAGSLDADIPVEQILDAYPSLTKEQIELAGVYAKVHPRRGRPRKLSELNPTWKPMRSKKIPPPTAA